MAQIAQQDQQQPVDINWRSLPEQSLPAPSTAGRDRRAHGSSSMLATAGRIALVLTSVGLACAMAAAMIDLHGPVPSAPGLGAYDSNGDPTAGEILMRRLRQLRGKDPVQELTLQISVGHLYRDQGQYARAAEHYQASLDLARAVEQKITAHQALGQVRLEQGLLAEARRHIEEALALHEQDQHPDASSDTSLLRILANTRRDQGHLEVAIGLYEKAWKSGRSQGDDEPILPLVAADCGEAFARQGRLDDAFAWLKEASKRARKQPPGSPEEAQIQSILGGVHHQRGEVAKAIELYQRALRSQSQALRATHTDLIATRLSLARALRDKGELEKALNMVEAVESTLRAGPKEGPDLSRALILKADLLREAKDYDLAEAAAREAMQQQAKVFEGQDHPDVAVASNTYGSVLHDSGKFKEALQLYNKALAMNLATVGKLHPETAATHNSLGTLFQDVGDMDAARKHFARTLEIQRKSVGEKSPEVANTYNNLATVLHQQGSSQEAAKLLQKALEVLDAAGVPATNPDRTIYAENLKEILKAQKTQDPAASVPQKPETKTE